MKVLILCNDFPPLNSIGARRPYSWFQYFRKFGIEPVVITKDWSGESGSPREILNQMSYGHVMEEETSMGTILRVPASTLLPERLLVRFGESRLSFVRRPLTFIYRLLAFSFSFFDKHTNIYREAKKILKENQVDCILITGEPFILFKYGFLLSKKFNVPWIADYRDCWLYNHVARYYKGIFNRVLAWWEFQYEKKYIQTALFITTADPHLASLLKQLHHKKTEVVYNGFDSFYQPASAKSNQSNQLIITHSGTITPGQRVEFLLDAVAALLREKEITSDDLKLNFIGLKYYPSQEERILNHDPILLNVINSTYRLPREQTLEINAHSDLLAAFTEKDYPIIYAKTYDYLAVKRPVMIVPGDGSLLSSFIQNLEAGHSFYSQEALKEFLLSKIEQKRRGAAVNGTHLNENKALFFTREKQAEQLASILKENIPVIS